MRATTKTASELEVGDVLNRVAQVVHIYKQGNRNEVHLDVRKLSDGTIWKCKLVPGKTFKVT